MNNECGYKNNGCDMQKLILILSTGGITNLLVHNILDSMKYHTKHDYTLSNYENILCSIRVLWILI